MQNVVENNQWVSAKQASNFISDALLLDWINSSVSLTKRLNEYTQNKIQFVLNKQNWIDSSTWCREISWEYNNKVWVLAKTFIPRETLGEFASTLQKNPERPIGEILFSDQLWKRGPIEICQIDDKNDYYLWAKIYSPNLPAHLVMRRAVFSAGEKKLTVVEVFLPEFLNE